MFKHGMLSTLVFAALVVSRANALDVTVVKIDGDEAAGKLTALNGDGVTVGENTVPAKEIAQVNFPGKSEKSAPTSPAVILRNRDAINQASIVSGSDTKLKLKSTFLEEFELEYKVVDAIVFYGTGKKMPEGLESILKAGAPKEDLLLTLKGESISGFYEKLSDKELFFNAGGQSRPYPFDQIAAVRFAETEKFEPNKALNATLRLSDDSRISVRPDGIDGGFIKVGAIDGNVWRIAGGGIVSLEYSGGRMVYLSALAPKSVEQKPYVGGAPFVFTWRKDRSAANGPLKIGETVYEKGIGVHSYCKLGYELGGAYAKFMADVGMDASAPAKAACAWRVLVDGKESAAGTSKAGGEKTALKIDVTSAKTLELICDFGPDDDDTGGRLDFARARLIKP